MSAKRQPNSRGNRDDENSNRINEQIRAREVRVVGDNVEQGIYTIQEARRMAQQQELDLVEISPNADPPVCKILDYQKFLYQQKKKAKEQKANQVKTTLKEIRFGPQTDDHDYSFKLRHAISFLQEGSKVRAYVFFRGRSIVFKDQGKLLLLRFANDLEDYARVDQLPKLEGKRMSMLFSPKKGVAKKKSDDSSSSNQHRTSDESSDSEPDEEA
ncbi:translation initiation factor IF-3 [uncultured Porphyromonas sp.]|uniref:translation initiation factor IF-3 n=1 Tax=uncultured Porphyromonas sp. TaxID=159274 RepID=UPI0025EF03CE|nr:translation initiation factor IF-3 [uncultured Porphyromonas sp.]